MKKLISSKRSRFTKTAILFMWIVLNPVRTLPAQEINVYFERLGSDAGLSMNNVNDIVQDKYGYLWIGTEDGLNRYDGYQFIVYRQIDGDENSLTNSYIECLLYDSQDRLWIGTREGMNLYVPEKDHFIRYTPAENDSMHMINRDIKDIYEDTRGRLWIAGENNVDVLNIGKGTFRHLISDPNDPSSLSYKTVYRIVENPKGQLCIATENGLNLMDPETFKVQRIFADPGNPNALQSSYIRCVLPDQQNNLWIGTYGSGLYYYNMQKNRFTHFPSIPGNSGTLSHNQVNDIAFHWDGNLWVATTEGLNYIQMNKENLKNSKIVQFKENPNDPYSLSAGHIQKILIDSNTIWLATRFGGISYYNKYGSKFRKYTTISKDGNGISHSNVTSFTQDNSNRVYIGTDGGGVNILDLRTGKFSYIRHQTGNPNSLSNDKVLSVRFEAPGILWVGMWDGGIDRYDIPTGRIRHYKNDPRNPGSVSSNNIFYLYLDHQNRLWVGTWGGGLNRYDRARDRFVRYPFASTDGSGTSGQTVMSMFEDRNGTLWLATEGEGLNVFDEKNNRFTYYQVNPNDSAAISSDYPYGILEDSRNRLWITTTNGLNLLDRATGKFKAFHMKDGLPSETLYGICGDDEGNLWISSIQGLSKVTPVEDQDEISIHSVNYTLQDGLQGEQFGQWSYFKNREGFIFFGGLKGFNMFHPEDIRKNPILPKMVINGFQLSLKPVSFRDAGSPLEKPVYLTDKIKLSYRESMLTFEFVGISFIQPEKNQYAYLLQNFDKDGDWHYVRDERKATYTNLDPGKYIFHVKGANNAGLWNEKDASLEIVITPPLWGTWWFRIGMILLAGFLTVFIYKLRTRSIKEHSLQLENEVKSRTEEVLKHKDEIEQAYSRMNQAVQKITMSMEKMTGLADIVSSTSSEFKTTSQHLATGANEHASSISEISSSLRELFTSASANAGNAQDANELSSQTQTLMTTSIEDMKNLSGVMKRIHHSTNETESVIRTMEEIATMIQMLSVNAAIEAMRAGEMGKGFQAVATEVQKLAEQSENAVQSTKNLIHNAIEQVEKGTQINQEVVRRFRDFGKLIERITGLVTEISSASVQQKLGIDQINSGVEQLNKVMQMSTDAARETVNRSENLFVHVEELRSLVNILNEAAQHLVGKQS